jgi:hypothetical protein
MKTALLRILQIACFLERTVFCSRTNFFRQSGRQVRILPELADLNGDISAAGAGVSSGTGIFYEVPEREELYSRSKRIRQNNAHGNLYFINRRVHFAI